MLRKAEAVARCFDGLRTTAAGNLELLLSSEAVTMRKAILNMLRSKTGRAFTAFRDWQALPERKDPGLNARASHFEKGLLRFVHCTLRRVHNTFS